MEEGGGWNLRRGRGRWLLGCLGSWWLRDGSDGLELAGEGPPGGRVDGQWSNEMRWNEGEDIRAFDD